MQGQDVTKRIKRAPIAEKIQEEVKISGNSAVIDLRHNKNGLR